MRIRSFAALSIQLAIAAAGLPRAAFAENLSTHNPTWWSKYEYLARNGSQPGAGSIVSAGSGVNVDISNECGPQSETYITLNPSQQQALAAGSNEIFRLPMRGYFSRNGGVSWGGVDLPLPPPIANGIDFGSDPTLAFDTRGNLFYGYIVVYFGAGSGVNGSQMAVARSTDGGKSYSSVNFFSFSSGSDHFNDKPMITADANSGSPFRDNVYIAWDAASGGSTGGGVRVAHSTDHGATFSVVRADDPKGPGRAIGTSPFIG